MALVMTEYCRECEKETMHTNGKCNICSERAERMRIAEWNAMTVDEKLTDLRRSVEALQRSPARY